MKSTFELRRPLSLLILGLTTATLAAGAFAADIPKRKSGLWEINTHMEGIPNMGPMQQCIDQNTDNLMQEQAQKEKPKCSVMDVKTQGNKVTMHSVCRIENTTATTDAVFTGAFDSAYKGNMHIRYNPPMQGMSESRMTMEARWLGACKAGQKPGDVIMPNMKNMNLNDMMKDPKFQEMMKRQK